MSFERHPDTVSSRGARIRAALRPRNAGIVYALVVLLAVLTGLSAAFGKNFYLSPINVANVLDQSANVGILVLFMTIVLIGGNFDLSVGSVAAFSAVAALEVVDQWGVGVAMVVALGSGVVFGLINGLIVEFLKVNAFIVTLGTMTAIRGLVLIVTGGSSVGATDPGAMSALRAIGGTFVTVDLLILVGVLLLLASVINGAVRLRGRRRLRLPVVLAAIGVVLVIAGVFVPANVSWTSSVWFMLVLALIVWAVLRFTAVGRRLYAVGGNAEAARLSGIAVRRYRVTTFVLTGAAAGFVGLLFASRLGSANPTALTGTELTVIAAAILGGTSLFGGSGNVLMSLFGALFLFTIANGFNVLNLGSNYQGLIQGVILIAAAATYTAALRTRRRNRKAEVDVATSASTTPAAPTSVETPGAEAASASDPIATTPYQSIQR